MILLLFAVKCLKNTPAFFAERLQKAMKVGTCDKIHKLIAVFWFCFFRMFVQLIGMNCSTKGIMFFSGLARCSHYYERLWKKLANMNLIHLTKMCLQPYLK